MEIWENLLNELRYETPDPLARFSSFQPDHIFITHRWEIWLGVFFFRYRRLFDVIMNFIVPLGARLTFHF